MTAEEIADLQDTYILSEIESLLKKTTSKKMDPITPQELEARALRGIYAIDKGHGSSTDEVKKQLGL